MQRLFDMPIVITAGRFDNQGRLLPTRINYNGNEHEVQTSTCGLKFGFEHNNAYFWLERGTNSWKITRCSR
ncbi:hypothetical protein EOL96_08275 [Candidatus Saccharibacteria bacterium]|nr:hypothetical protein [Candidatus Saccharibacteria bacterium]